MVGEGTRDGIHLIVMTCAFEYEYPPFGMYAGMGCTKFSAELLARFPDALTARVVRVHRSRGACSLQRLV